jgi:hypothetical protein
MRAFIHAKAAVLDLRRATVDEELNAIYETRIT